MVFAPPPANCGLCARLAAFRDDNRRRFADFHNAPVESFGPLTAALLVVGLAPGLRGAYRTGRPFTGDAAGDLLYPTLLAHGLAAGDYSAHADGGRRARRDDALVMRDCRITNAVRCVPPDNKPIGAEVRACGAFLAAEIAAMAELRAILALGRVAHDAVLSALERRRAEHAFGHGAELCLGGGRRLFDSYHCSRYNTNTGRLTPAMFDAVFVRITSHLARR